MDSTAIAGVSQGVIAYLPLGLPLGITALFVWAVLRTESWHLLRRRFWQVLHGKGEITDSGIRAFVEDQSNLAAFRIFVGPAAATLEEARTLMEWCRTRDVDLGSLRMCGDHFDLKSRRIKVSERYLKWLGGFWRVCTVIFPIAGLVSLQLISSSQALLTVKASGQDFFASVSGARAVWPLLDGPAITSEDCGNAEVAADRVRLSKEDTQVICRLLLKPGFDVYIRNALSEQRAALALLGIAFFAAMYFAGVWALTCASALKMLRRQVDPALPGAQLELDFDGAR